MQKAQKSWFIDIQRIKYELIAQNESINWFPDHFKYGRFLKSLESAPDWCISRSRFWGTPMPVWQNRDGSERVVIDSREELYQKNKPLGQITKLVILRHAQSEANVARCYDDTGTSPLSEFGKQQAQDIVEELKTEGVEVIISSPFVRTLQTIKPFAELVNIEIQTMEELRETGHGKFSNAPWSELLAQDREKMWQDFDYKFGETGESVNDLIVRTNEVLNTIKTKFPGKTVTIVSHGYPIRTLLTTLRGKLSERPTNAKIEVVYFDNNTGKELNLHRPTIDRIYLPGTGEKPKKVLGIHGYNKTGAVVDFFQKTKEALAQEGIQMDTPFFESGESVDYKNWEKVFDSLDIESYDTWITHSMGAKMARQYIVNRKLPIPRLILVSPRYESSTRAAMEKVEREQLTHTFEELVSFAREIIVIHSEDDSVVPYSSGKKVAEILRANLVTVSGCGHFNVEYSQLITGIILHGAPLRRIPEVLDVWMDSASMPYAQVHYPFENQAKMEASFPADFIAEYTGQIRAWFYVMHVI